MNVELSIIVSLVGVMLSIITFFVGRQSAARSQGETDGNLKTDLMYIKQGISEIQNELKAQRNTNTEFAVRLSKVEDSLKSVHKRVDGFEKHLGVYSERGD